ncbi:MAG: DUF1853 family protein [Opitutaceae bacterium]
MQTIQQLIRQSLLADPLLVGDLHEAAALDRSLLGRVEPEVTLNFNQKLGHLYEDALEQLLDASDSLECLASHMQIIDDSGVTLGELDFVLYDKLTEAHIHLELAVKFYLAVETSNGWEFPGPDPRDNWQRKLDRMRSHQLVLSQYPESRRLLKERFQVGHVEARQLIYGCIFLPMSCEAVPLPDSISESARKGRWLYISEWDEFFPEVKEVLLVPKVLWPAELCEKVRSSLELIDVSQLKAESAGRCTMFVLQGAPEPLFLVPDDWLG